MLGNSLCRALVDLSGLCCKILSRLMIPTSSNILPNSEAKCRYQTSKKPYSYGMAVYSHLNLVRSKLQGDTKGKRQGWLRLVKDIADYVAAIGQKKEQVKAQDVA